MAKSVQPAPTVEPASYPDLRITVELGATMPVLEFGNVRPLIRIEGIDPSGDVARQIEVALDTAGAGFGAIDQRFDQLISEIMSPANHKPGFSARVGKLEEAQGWTKRNLDKIAGKLREVDTAQKALVAAVEARQPASAPVAAQGATAADVANKIAAQDALAARLAEAARLDQETYDRTRAAEKQEEIGAH